MAFTLTPVQARALGEAVSLYRASVRSVDHPIVGTQDLARLKGLGRQPELLERRPALYGAALYLLKRAFADSDPYLRRWHYHTEARADALRDLMVAMREGFDTRWAPRLNGKEYGSLSYLREIGAVEGGGAQRRRERGGKSRTENRRPTYPLSRPSHVSEDYPAPTLPTATVRVDGNFLAWACTQVFHRTKTEPYIDPAQAQSLGLALASTDSRNDGVIQDGRYPFTLVAAFPDGGKEFPLAFPHQVLGATVPRWLAAKFLAHVERGGAKT